MKRCIAVLIVTTLFFGQAFSQKTFYWYRDLLLSPDTSKFVITERDTLVIEKHDIRTNASITLNRELDIRNPTIKGNWFGSFSKLHFTKPVFISSSEAPFISNCQFDQGVYLILENNKVSNHSFINNTINGQLIIQLSNCAYFGMAHNTIIVDESILPFDFIREIGDTDSAYWKIVFDTLQIYQQKVSNEYNSNFLQLSFSQCGTIDIEHNDFTSFTKYATAFGLNHVNNVTMRNNKFGGDLVLYGVIEDDFRYSKNKLQGLYVANKLHIPPSMEIEWNEIRNHIAVSVDTTMNFNNIPYRYYSTFLREFFKTAPKLNLDSTYNESNINITILYSGSTSDAVLNKIFFNKLVETYKKLYDHYKQKGDRESSNGVFVAVKDLEGSRLAAVYKDQGGSKNFFNWRLNRLMKFYTNHATDPGLALVISFYLMLCFSVFYFFFPSEWDIDSKSRLVKHFKDFVEKNEKGYWKPFLKMMYGFLISFINALTLSLNSFITLGFGNIPTRGVARYVCIIQGFLGWFLLSIFTVALFNQILF